MEAKDRVNVLLVDDQPGKLLSYQVMLAELDENLVPVSSASEALAYLLKSEVAVILVDVCMPELDGFELAKMIREHPRFQKTAIIFISAIHMTEADYLRGYEAGAVDYLSVPVVPELLRAKVRVFAELFRKTRALHELNHDLERRVSERTQALEAFSADLRRSEQDRSLALAAGNMGSWAYEAHTGKWFWDEGQSHIFGVPHQSFSPSMARVRQAVHPEDFAGFRDAILSLTPQKGTAEAEIRIVRPGGEIRWCAVAVVASFDEAGKALRFSGVTTDITERKQAELRQTLLAREVDHRAKNALAVVQAIVRLARRDSIADYARAIEGRITALAQTHELLSQARWEGADMLRLVLEELAPYHGGAQSRVTAIGPSVMVSPETAQAVAMALHELATNAAKYGSLSSPSGRVDISWSYAEGVLSLTWVESGGPPVSPPKATGFGTKIINSFNGDKRGRVSFNWRPQGLDFSMAIHCKAKEGDEASPRPMPPAVPAPLPAPAANSNGRGPARILLVEDEMLVGVFMHELLSSIGYRPTQPMTRLGDALAAARREKFDCAVLDMNLNGEAVYPLAELLRAQQVPFVFLTGYSPDGVETRFCDVPVLQKPVMQETLEGTLESLLRPAAPLRRSAERTLSA
ncbi:MAG: response regulator [Alphaproteobacteria bacterium]|nr:response regulator [Alphaproteobacteria bacterium]